MKADVAYSLAFNTVDPQDVNGEPVDIELSLIKLHLEIFPHLSSYVLKDKKFFELSKPYPFMETFDATAILDNVKYIFIFAC